MLAGPLLTIILLCLAVGLLPVALLAVYEDWRFGRWHPVRTVRTFACVKCNQIYERRGRLRQAPCPHCGHPNLHIQI